jgi:hypothetical protein
VVDISGQVWYVVVMDATRFFITLQNDDLEEVDFDYPAGREEGFADEAEAERFLEELLATGEATDGWVTD